MEAHNLIQPRILCFAAPKGGVGRTTLSIETAKALAAKNQKILLLDLNATTQSSILSFELTPQKPQLHQPYAPIPTNFENIHLLLIDPLPTDINQTINDLRALHNYDWIIIDTQPSLSDNNCQLFLNADLPILISCAEPSSLFAATQWLWTLLHFKIQNTQIYQNLNYILEGFNVQSSFDSLFKKLRNDSDKTNFINLCTSINCAFILNKRREASENLQAHALCHAWGLHCGIYPQLLATIIYEERRWFYTRKLAPPIIYPSDDTVLGDCDTLAKKILDPTTPPLSKNRPCLPIIDINLNPKKFLQIANNTEPRQAYRKLWEAYKRENGLVSNILTQETIKNTIQLLETAYRKATLADENANPTTPIAQKTAYARASLTDNTLNIIQYARIQKNITQKELSLKTKIPLKYIENLESNNLSTIPRAYLKAYLSEIAKILEIEQDLLFQLFLNSTKSSKQHNE